MEMVERVARAMKERASQPLANIPSLEPVLTGSLGDAWKVLAIAAIEAMRTPTEAMVNSALKYGDSEGNGSVSSFVAEDTWSSMIDAALTPDA